MFSPGFRHESCATWAWQHWHFHWGRRSLGQKALYDSTILWCKKKRFLWNESTKRSNQNVTDSLSFCVFSPVVCWCECLLNALNVNVNVILLMYQTNKTQSGEYCENVPLDLFIQILRFKKLLHPKDHEQNMLMDFIVFYPFDKYYTVKKMIFLKHWLYV